MGEFLLGVMLGIGVAPAWNAICGLFHIMVKRASQKPVQILEGHYVDWKTVPNQGQYVAIDKDGWIKWFRAEPTMGGLDRAWITGDGEGMTPGIDFGLLLPPATARALPPWRESLRQRPKE